MIEIQRILKINLPPAQSAFLWGPRKAGKSMYLRSHFPESMVFDLLDTELHLDLLKRPALFRERLLAQNPKVLAKPVIVDEVQKVPLLLDEIHWLIENRGLSFILCGSSARKLLRGGGNLLGGRAWRYLMLPLTSVELKKMNLLRALNNGLLPSHYLQENATMSLQAYVRDYLKEEILAEGLTRNMPAFSRFLDAVGYSHGELVSYANIASDCGVDSKTVKEYYQILCDTLLGSMIEPFKKRQNRQIIIKAARFYLFDTGVAGSLSKRRIQDERGEVFGKAFEHLILMELQAHSSYKNLNYDINFWRTKTGLEVDFILGRGEVAIEVKGSTTVRNEDLRPMKAFFDEYKPTRALVVCNEKARRTHDGITILPWREFLDELWGGGIIK